ncbi:MAG: hypothetical protein LBU27_08740 [Candidatus Peribacteria bacterium]|nr:hypothetical protein [Candidatus Peribacteria bacterium]
MTEREPNFFFTLTYSPAQPTTGAVVATVTLIDTGTLTFVDPTGRTTTDNVVFTKTYLDNLTGEEIRFQNASGGTKTDSITILWIMLEATITYTPE